MAIGAYAVERDYSHYVAQASQTVLAVVGTATKGPVGEVVACTSAQDLVNKFGTPQIGHYALYAAQYFLSQSSKVYFVRAAKDASGSKAIVSGTVHSGTSLSDALEAIFRDPGSWGDNHKLKVEVVSDNKYTLTLKKPSGATVETIKDFSIEDITSADGLIYESEYLKIHVGEDTVTLEPGEYSFSSGHDGDEYITSADYITAAGKLAADNLDMNLIAIPGITDPAVVTAMLALAETRGDCLYLVDPPKGLTRDGVIAWHNGSGEYTHTAFNSSYGALYFDWVDIYDSINKVTVSVPPSVVAAATYAYSDRTSELWYAPAGMNRGIVRGALGSVTKLSRGDVDLLYSGDNNINSIYEDPQVGLVLWGQKTLLRSETALNRVNVRRLLNYLKRVVVAATNYLVFEPNDRVTWNRFEMKMKPVLETIKTHRGIYDYRIVKGETIVTDSDIDNYRMPCMIMIRPTKAAEEIPVYFVISSTGAEFNEVLEANGIIVD